MRERKTTRVYGAVASAIRTVAKRGDQFTISDVCDTHYANTRRMLSLLVKRGEIARVKMGGGDKKTIYQSTV